jgi:hypothetical protein
MSWNAGELKLAVGVILYFGSRIQLAHVTERPAVIRRELCVRFVNTGWPGAYPALICG